MARIYVSSTMHDLREHRLQVTAAIRRLGHVVVSMEDYVAEDRPPLDRCLQDVRSVDAFVLLLAWWYGDRPDGHRQSYTELEYDEARRAGIPVFVFLHDGGPTLPLTAVERAAHAEVDAFREKAGRDRLGSMFGTSDQLARLVGEALQKWQPRAAGPDRAVDWEAYRTRLAAAHEWIKLDVIAGPEHDRLVRIPLCDVFVPQRVVSGRPVFDLPDDHSEPTAEPGSPPGAALTGENRASMSVLGGDRRQVVLGGPGTGKTSLLQYLILQLCAPAPATLPAPLQDRPLPFLVELRRYTADGFTDFVRYLSVRLAELDTTISPDALAEVLASAGTLVLLDGLDEILDPGQRARAVEQFQAFARRFPAARVCVTSRIAGYDEVDLGLADFRHYTLLDFGMAEVRRFVEGWYRHYVLPGDDREAAELVRRIAENPRLLELAGNPLLLTMMAILYKHQDLPEKRWELYRRSTAVLLEQWDLTRKRIARTEALPLGVTIGMDQKAEILQRVAEAMLSRTPASGTELNAIRYERLRDVIADYLVEQYRKPPGEAAALSVEILHHLRQRTYILAEIGDRIFGFVHRTFMEYFAAGHILAEFMRRRADYRWLVDEVFAPRHGSANWREPLLLLSGMLAGQDLPVRDVVDALARLPRGSAPSALPFAALCLGEAGRVPAADLAWASGLLTRLITALRRPPGRDAGGDAWVADALRAFALLAPWVPVEAQATTMMEEMADSRSVNERIVGWQLQLAQRSRTDRRFFALDGLAHRDEAVRRAAVAALHREWPGHEEAGRALLERLRVEPNSRVREDIITTVDSGWPGRTELLDVLAARAGTETAPSHVVWLARHLATAWAGSERALDLVLGLAGTQRYRDTGPGSEVGADIQDALLAGWAPGRTCRPPCSAGPARPRSPRRCGWRPSARWPPAGATRCGTGCGTGSTTPGWPPEPASPPWSEPWPASNRWPCPESNGCCRRPCTTRGGRCGRGRAMVSPRPAGRRPRFSWCCSASPPTAPTPPAPTQPSAWPAGRTTGRWWQITTAGATAADSSTRSASFTRCTPTPA